MFLFYHVISCFKFYVIIWVMWLPPISCWYYIGAATHVCKKPRWSGTVIETWWYFKWLSQYHRSILFFPLPLLHFWYILKGLYYRLVDGLQLAKCGCVWVRNEMCDLCPSLSQRSMSFQRTSLPRSRGRRELWFCTRFVWVSYSIPWNLHVFLYLYPWLIKLRSDIITSNIYYHPRVT